MHLHLLLCHVHLHTLCYISSLMVIPRTVLHIITCCYPHTMLWLYHILCYTLSLVIIHTLCYTSSLITRLPCYYHVIFLMFYEYPCLLQFTVQLSYASRAQQELQTKISISIYVTPPCPTMSHNVPFTTVSHSRLCPTHFSF
jgi:hypothetical protein